MPAFSQGEMITAGHISVDRKAFLNANTQKQAAMLCSGCHGKDGSGDRFFGPEAMWGTPMIRGIHKDYFADQLRKYKSGERIQTGDNPGEMNKFMQDPAMTEDIIDNISAYYAGMDQLGIDKEILSQLDGKEKQKFLSGGTIFNAQCASCHGKDAMGVPGSAVPHLAGQVAAYTRNRMLFFTHEAESGSQSVMGDILRFVSLSNDEIESIVFYLENIIGKR
jgi:cytochrome c553